MELIDIFAICVLATLGIRITYTDLRFGKIYNRDIQWGLVAAVASFILYLGIGAMTDSHLSWEYVQHYLYNGVLSLFIAYFFWSKGIWAAGDGKLFFVVSLLVPLSWYSRSYFPVYPSFALLLNVILPLVCFIVLRISLMFFRPSVLGQFREGFRRSSVPLLFLTFAQFIGLYLVGKLFLRVVFSPLRDMIKSTTTSVLGLVLHDGTLLVLSLIVALWFMRSLRKVMWLYYLLGGMFALGGVGALLSGHVSLSEVGPFLFSGVALFMIALMLLKVSLVKLLLFLRVEGVSIEQLREGMIITPAAKATLKELDSDYFSVLELNARGLVDDQIQAIRSWFLKHQPPKEGHDTHSLEVYKTTAFGPFIILGVFITLILQGALGYVWLF